MKQAYKRETWVDYSRAAAIILVVYGHVARGLMDAEIIRDKFLFQLIDSIIYSFHIPLFFFLSGLFFQNSLKKYGKTSLIIRKIETILYPYVLWSLIQGTIMVLLSKFTNSKVTFFDVFSLLWEPRDQFWFLYALFMIFVLAVIVYRNFSDKWVITIFFLSALFYIFQSKIPPDINFFHIDYISNNFVFFAAGILMKDFIRKDEFYKKSSVLMLGICFIFSQYFFHIILHKTFEDKGFLSLIIAIVSIFFIVALCQYAATRKKVESLLFIGFSSLEIYILHVLSASGTRIILQNFFNVSNLYLHLLLGMVSGIIFPIIVVIIVKKYRIPYVFALKLSKH